MAQTVLITGGAGFIGSRLALSLAAAGHSVRVLDSLSPQIHGDRPESSALLRSILGKVEFVHGSVTSRDDLLRTLPGVDTIVHLAAETGTGQSMYAIQHYADVNVGGTALLLDLVANGTFPVRKFVVASSRAVYGEGKYRCATHGFVYPSPRSAEDLVAGVFAVRCPYCGVPAACTPTDEESRLSPSSVYGITKLTQEQMVLTVCKSLGVSALAFRYQNVYGPGQSLSNPYTGILSIFSTRIRNGAGLNIFEDGQESRDFVFVDDVVDLTRRAIEDDEPRVDVFNVGSGVGTNVSSIVNTLLRHFGATVPATISGHFRLGDIRHNVADLVKVRSVFGFAPAVSIEDGLLRFVAWVQGETVPVDRYDTSLEELRSRGLFK